MFRQSLMTLVLVLLVTGSASGQGTPLPSSEAKAFMGTWVFAMTEPAGANTGAAGAGR